MHTIARNIPARSFLLVLAALLLSAFCRAADQAPSAPAPQHASAVPAYRQADRLAILEIHGPVDEITFLSLTRRMNEAREWGADAVVIKVNTPGGDMYKTLEICSLLKDRSAAPANIVAWVNPNAYSAGTIIALACREIVVTPNGRFGDAAPISYSPLTGLMPLPAAERAKLETPLLAEVIDSARRNHYDEKLVQSFVRVSDGLWLLQHKRTGERVVVDKAEYISVFGEEPPVTTGILAPSPQSIVPAPFLPWADQSIPRAVNTDGLAPKDIENDIQKAQSLPPLRQPLTSDVRNDWTIVRQVVGNTTLLTVNADEAAYYGLATMPIASGEQLAAYFGNPLTRTWKESWSEQLVRFLTSIPVRIVLIVIFLVCLFVEISFPGIGIFGLTALLAVALLVGAPALIGLSQWWTALLVLAGLALVAAEVFVVPGTGITGIAGIACILVGLIMSFITRDLSTAAGAAQLWTALLTIVVGSFSAGVAIWFVSRHVKSMPLLNRVILHAQVKGSAHAPGAADVGSLNPIRIAPGMEGLAVSDLRPAGRAEFLGRIIDVSSIGSYIEKGSRVRVVTAGQFQIEVEEVTA